MNFIKKQPFPSLIILLFLSFAIFWKFFIYGLYPFPGDLLLGWHEPWRSEYVVDGRIMLANKPVADDVFKQIYPLRTLAIDMMKRLEPPLWNPYNGAGMPLLATLNNGFLDPFNILFLVLPYPLAWSLYIILQPAIIAVCMYLFCRKISLSNTASLFAAIAFMFSGFVTVRIIFGMYGFAIALLPFFLWLIESYIKEGVSKKTLLFPLAVFVLLVSTQPQLSLYILTFTSIYFLTRLLRDENKIDVKIRKTALLTILFLLGLGLAAVQLFPTLELFQHAHISSKASSFIIKTHLLPFTQLLSMLIPNYFGNASLYNYWGAGDYIQTIAAFGLIPIFFGYWNIGKIKNKIDTRKFFLVGAIVSIALSVDWIGTQKIFSLGIPILSTGAPSRILFLTIFSLSILAGYGFDKWLYKKISMRKTLIKIIPYILIVTTILLGTFLLYQKETPCKYGVITYCRVVALRNTILETGAFVSFLFFFFGVLLFRNTTLKRLCIIGVFFIVTTVGIYNANKFLPFSPPSSFFPEHSIIKTLREAAGYGRVFGLGEATFTPNTETQFRLYSPQYYHPLYIARYRELLEYANNGIYSTRLPRGEPHIRSESNPNPKLQERRDTLLSMLGTTHLIVSKDEVPKEQIKNIVWENSTRYMIARQNVSPRTYIVHDFEVISNPKEILETLFTPGFSTNNTVILEEHPQILTSKPSDTKPKKDKAVIEQYKENKVVIETESDENGIVVLSDNYYPGWKAYVDGKEVNILRANYSFRAVEVPYGKHTVAFAYKPQSFSMGLFISGLSLLLYCVILIRTRRA